MKIAEVSSKYDISADTLRYYERIGLLPTVTRDSSGNRDYSEVDCNWVTFIKCMRHAGLSIEALIEYVEMFQQGDSTLEARKELLLEQRAQLRQRIGELQDTLSYLDKKIENYGNSPLNEFEEKLRK
jgi:DNA-binding transcriptional MerR regulator